MTRLIRLIVLLTAILVMPLSPQIVPSNEQTIDCLAKGIYFEAGNQSPKGKEAVAWVIFNRSKDFNKSICEVTHQKIGRYCQFIWYCDSISNVPPNNKNWVESRKLARNMIEYPQNYSDFTNGAKFFHATYVRPVWRNHRTFTIKIGSHLFYR
jgi:N-acetylmuramoyl-L-alanine amidase